MGLVCPDEEGRLENEESLLYLNLLRPRAIYIILMPSSAGWRELSYARSESVPILAEYQIPHGVVPSFRCT